MRSKQCAVRGALPDHHPLPSLPPLTGFRQPQSGVANPNQRRWRIVVTAIVLAALGCSSEEPDQSQADEAPRARTSDSDRLVGSAPSITASDVLPSTRLVDSLPWEDNEWGLEGVLYRVEITLAGRVDTLPAVFTKDLPVLTNDTVVLGLNYEQDRVTSVFQYDPISKELDSIHMPERLEDFQSYFSRPSFSPNGNYLAYVAYAGGGAQAVVRNWPELEIVFDGPNVEIPPTDFVVNDTKWLNDATFALAVDLGGAPHRGWLRIVGSVDGRTIRADTIHADAFEGDWVTIQRRPPSS